MANKPETPQVYRRFTSVEARIDAAANREVVGGKQALQSREARLERVNWISGEMPIAPVLARVRIRHGHPGAPARIEPPV